MDEPQDIGQLANEATRGPWSQYHQGVVAWNPDGSPARHIVGLIEETDRIGSGFQQAEGERNLRFIAAARRAIAPAATRAGKTLALFTD